MCTHTYTQCTHACTHACTQHTCTCMHTTHTCTRTHTDTHTHSHAHTCTRAHAHTFAHTCTRIHAHAHTPPSQWRVAGSAGRESGAPVAGGRLPGGPLPVPPCSAQLLGLPPRLSFPRVPANAGVLQGFILAWLSRRVGRVTCHCRYCCTDESPAQICS